MERPQCPQHSVSIPAAQFRYIMIHTKSEIVCDLDRNTKGCSYITMDILRNLQDGSVMGTYHQNSGGRLNMGKTGINHPYRNGNQWQPYHL